MRIRSAQMHAFTDHLEKSFAAKQTERLCRDFHEEIKEKQLSRMDVDRMVNEGVKKARTYGVVSPEDVELFLDCMLLLGSEFEHGLLHPEIEAILNERDLTGFEKMERIHSYLILSYE